MRIVTAVVALALTAPSLAWSQAAQIPERVLRLNYVEGVVKFQAEDAPAPTTLPNRPLIPGDRLITKDGGRAELALDTSAVRLDERSELRVEKLDATSVQITLNRGVASLRLRELLEGETFGIATSNAAITLAEPGEYRVEATAEDTVLSVRNGVADVATAQGPVRVASGQRVRLEGYEAQANLEPASSTDDFDDWVLDREVRIAEAEPSYNGFEAQDSYEELDRNGEWYDDPGYGQVWMPSYAYGGWDQFSHGRWQHSGYGWSWASGTPWGFFTFNSGRWAYLHDRNRWCWVPSPRPHHPTRVVSETHPFGHSSRPVIDPRDRGGGRAVNSPAPVNPPARPNRQVHSLGSAPRNPPPAQPAAAPAPQSPSRTATMRPSTNSSPKTSTPSSNASRSNSVFASPQYRQP